MKIRWSSGLTRLYKALVRIDPCSAVSSSVFQRSRAVVPFLQKEPMRCWGRSPEPSSSLICFCHIICYQSLRCAFDPRYASPRTRLRCLTPRTASRHLDPVYIVPLLVRSRFRPYGIRLPSNQRCGRSAGQRRTHAHTPTPFPERTWAGASGARSRSDGILCLDFMRTAFDGLRFAIVWYCARLNACSTLCLLAYVHSGARNDAPLFVPQS